MANNLESRIAELERQHGAAGYKLVLHVAGETEVEARTREGLAGWTGVIIFMSELDMKL